MTSMLSHVLSLTKGRSKAVSKRAGRRGVLPRQVRLSRTILGPGCHELGRRGTSTILETIRSAGASRGYRLSCVSQERRSEQPQHDQKSANPCGPCGQLLHAPPPSVIEPLRKKAHRRTARDEPGSAEYGIEPLCACPARVLHHWQ